MNIIIYGPPGSGKSTQAKLLAERFGFLRIASGDLSRQIASEDTDEGRMVKDILAKGGLTPDDIIFRRIRKTIDASDLSKGLVMDGYPRNNDQIFLVEELNAEKQINIDRVVVIDLPEQDGKERMLKRAQIEGRSDDTPDAIAKRFQVYVQNTQPIIDYYTQKGIVVHVDGRPTVEEIHTEICRVLGLQ